MFPLLVDITQKRLLTQGLGLVFTTSLNTRTLPGLAVCILCICCHVLLCLEGLVFWVSPSFTASYSLSTFFSIELPEPHEGRGRFDGETLFKTDCYMVLSLCEHCPVDCPYICSHPLQDNISLTMAEQGTDLLEYVVIFSFI